MSEKIQVSTTNELVVSLHQRLLDAQEAHTARLAALDAEIAEMERAHQAAADRFKRALANDEDDETLTSLGDESAECAYVVSGLRRAREIITGGKP